MTVGDLIKKLEFWNRDLPVVIEDGHMFDEIKADVKMEVFYDKETGDLLAEEEEGATLEKLPVIVLTRK